jgi:hypothetical protein
MYTYIKTLWFSFFDICRLHKGPQDLPDSPTLLWLVVAIYAPLQVTINALGGEMSKSFVALVVDLGLMWLLTASLLYIAKYPSRIRQTLTALIGTNCIINLLTLPLWIWFWSLSDGNQSNPNLAFIGLMLLGLGIWNLVILAHIFRHALSTTFGIGMMVAVVFVGVFFVAMFTLFPAPAA